MAIFMVVLGAVVSAVWLLRPWQREAMLALINHPPLEPYVAMRWWEARLLRFGRTAWRALLAIQALFLSVLLGADLRDVQGPELASQWYATQVLVLAVVLLFIMLGLAVDLAVSTWRITRLDSWTFERRGLLDALFPAGLISALLVAGWAEIINLVR